MRKACCVLMLFGLSVLSGCVVVTRNKGTLTAASGWHQAVAVDGKLYIVDVRTGTVSRIDPKAIETAEPYEGVSSTTIDVTVVED